MRRESVQRRVLESAHKRDLLPNAYPLMAGTIRLHKGPDMKLELNKGVFYYGKSSKISEPKISRIPRQTCRMVFAKGKQQVRTAEVQWSQATGLP